MNSSLWLSKQFLEKNKKELQKEFLSNTPFPHILIENFLKESQAKKLLEALKKETFEKKQSDAFSFSQTNYLSKAQQRILKELYQFFQSKESTKIISQVAGIKLKHGMLEIFGRLYEDTNYYLCHNNYIKGRKIEYIYSLSEDVKEKEGGALVFLSNEQESPKAIIKKYFPIWNSLIIFQTSKSSWHEIEEILSSKKRYTIEGAFY